MIQKLTEHLHVNPDLEYFESPESEWTVFHYPKEKRWGIYWKKGDLSGIGSSLRGTILVAKREARNEIAALEKALADTQQPLTSGELIEDMSAASEAVKTYHARGLEVLFFTHSKHFRIGPINLTHVGGYAASISEATEILKTHISRKIERINEAIRALQEDAN